jgi:hypothetical protein
MRAVDCLKETVAGKAAKLALVPGIEDTLQSGAGGH